MNDELLEKYGKRLRELLPGVPSCEIRRSDEGELMIRYFGADGKLLKQEPLKKSNIRNSIFENPMSG
jgi:hypothetical protein